MRPAAVSLALKGHGLGSYIDGDVAELWPAQSMVHVVLAEVIFWQVRDVRLLDVRNVGRMQQSDIHRCDSVSSQNVSKSFLYNFVIMSK